MSLESWARTAFTHTRVTLVIGMNNQPYRVAQTGGWSVHMVKAMREEEGTWQKDEAGHWAYAPSGTRHAYHGDTLDRVRQVAERAASIRAGNCGEHACVAFVYLIDNAKEQFLVSKVSLTGGGDHSFVVLNRATGNNGSAPAAWGDGCLILDVWGRFICTHSQLMSAGGAALYAEIEEENVAMVQNYIRYYPATVACERRTMI